MELRVPTVFVCGFVSVGNTYISACSEREALSVKYTGRSLVRGTHRAPEKHTRRLNFKPVFEESGAFSYILPLSRRPSCQRTRVFESRHEIKEWISPQRAKTRRWSTVAVVVFCR